MATNQEAGAALPIADRFPEVRHWFFQTLTPEQRAGFFEAWCGIPKGTQLSLGLQFQVLEKTYADALLAKLEGSTDVW
jgi:hypothetical protein